MKLFLSFSLFPWVRSSTSSRENLMDSWFVCCNKGFIIFFLRNSPSHTDANLPSNIARRWPQTVPAEIIKLLLSLTRLWQMDFVFDRLLTSSQFFLGKKKKLKAFPPLPSPVFNLLLSTLVPIYLQVRTQSPVLMPSSLPPSLSSPRPCSSSSSSSALFVGLISLLSPSLCPSPSPSPPLSFLPTSQRYVALQLVCLCEGGGRRRRRTNATLSSVRPREREREKEEKPRISPDSTDAHIFFFSSRCCVFYVHACIVNVGLSPRVLGAVYNNYVLQRTSLEDSRASKNNQFNFNAVVVTFEVFNWSALLLSSPAAENTVKTRDNLVCLSRKVTSTAISAASYGGLLRHKCPFFLEINFSFWKRHILIWGLWNLKKKEGAYRTRPTACTKK